MMDLKQFLFCALLVTGVVCYEIITPPPDQTAAGIGEDVIIPCGVRTTSNQAEFVEWKEFVDAGSTGQRIWLSPPNTDGITHPNSTKYEVAGMFDLNIKSASIYDGGKYTCSIVIGNIVHEAHLMIIAKPECSSSAAVYEGEEMEVFCRGEFGGEQKPEMIMDKDRNRLQTTITDDQVYSRTIRSNFTADWTDDGEEVICFSRTSNPSHSENCSMTIGVRHSVRDMNISPDTNVHYVGEQINCTVSGNPRPDVTWERATGGGLIRSAFLPITADMMSSPQNWVCRAQNTVRNQIHRAEQHHNFTVLPAGTAEPIGASSISRSNPILHILSLLFILLISLTSTST